MELYYIFYKVAEQGNISKAAESLYVSQPAVTKSIKNLENNLGVQLFNRTSKGVSLTEEGKILYEHVKNAFVEIEQGEQLIKKLKDKNLGVVKIGISNTLCKYYFMPHLKKFHEMYPNLKIEITNRTTVETMELLEKGVLDCAIVSKIDDESRFIYKKLMEIQDIFVGKTKPPKPLMTLKELEEYPMLFLEKKNATRQYIDRYLLKNSANLQIDIEISAMEFLVEFAKIGLGIASVIKNFISDDLKKERLFEWVIIPKIEPRSIGLVYPKGTSFSIASKTFIDFMSK